MAATHKVYTETTIFEDGTRAVRDCTDEVMQLRTFKHNDSDRLLSTEEAAEYLRLPSRGSIYSLIQSGQLIRGKHYRRVGQRNLFFYDALRKLAKG